MSDYEEIVDDDGQVAGYATEAEDGAIIGISLDGQIVSAIDPSTGNELDASEYQFADEQSADEPAGEYDEHAAEVEARIAELEQRVENPPQFAYERTVDEIDQGRLDNDMDNQAAYLERALDRPLTLSERRRIGQEAMADLDAGDLRPDLLAAAARLGDTGQPLADLDTGNRGRDHETRTAYMAERLRDAERVENAEHNGDDDLTSEQPPASQDYYDLDSREERLAYLSERVEGRADESQAYSSSDIQEEP